MVVDDGGNFKGVLTSICNILVVTLYMVSKDNHREVRVDKFFGLPNKTSIIGLDVSQEFAGRLALTTFSIYDWTGSPVDGKNIIR